MPSRGSHAAGTRGTGGPTRGHCHPGMSPRSTHTPPHTPGGNPFHPTSPSRAFGRAAQLSALRQPCVGIAAVPVEPHGLRGSASVPHGFPCPGSHPPWGRGHPRCGVRASRLSAPGGSTARRHGLRGMLAAGPVSGPGSFCPVSRRAMSHAPVMYLDIKGCCSPSGTHPRGGSVTVRGCGLWDGHFNTQSCVSEFPCDL